MRPEVKWLEACLDEQSMLPEMQVAMDAIYRWSIINHGYESKNQRIEEWSLKTSGCVGLPFYEIVCHIFINCLMHPEGMTYQAMIGSIANDVQCADPLDQAKCAAEIIALVYQAELIEITKVNDQTMMITTEFELPVDIPEFNKHLPEWAKPAPVTYNPILGNRFKQHEGDICREHLDRTNAISLCLETRILGELEETTKAELDTQEKLDQWGDFKTRSDLAYAKVIDKGNRFYLKHSVDTRGRTYCSGYYISYQGASFKKAIVQLADKRIVKL
jgi:hypothetical protein